MDKEKAKEAYEKWLDYVLNRDSVQETSLKECYLAGAEWAWGEVMKDDNIALNSYKLEVEELQAQLARQSEKVGKYQRNIGKEMNKNRELQAELSQVKKAKDALSAENKELQDELFNVFDGMKGACPTCEPVGEMNKKLRECVGFYGQARIKEEVRGTYARECLKEIEGE